MTRLGTDDGGIPNIGPILHQPISASGCIRL
jgi:hypothetical protein